MRIAAKHLRLVVPALFFVLSGVALSDAPGVNSGLVLYSSEDQPCSEPIIHDFERDTGIKVSAVYDKESAEVVMKRLIAEKDAPQADVYWANEPTHPDLLKEMEISEPYVSPSASAVPAMFKDPDGHWTAFSARARVLVVRSNSVHKPNSVLAYTDPQWKGKAVLANPLLNTTTDNLAALFNLWGESRGRRFLEEMKSNKVMSAPGNPQSAELVGAGKADLSLVDIDDALTVVSKNKSVSMIYPDQGQGGIGVFMVPNAIEMIKGAKHPAAAHKLIDYILSAESQRKLASSPCAQTPLIRGVTVPGTVKRIEDLKVMQVNYSDIRRTAEKIRPVLKAWSRQ